MTEILCRWLNEEVRLEPSLSGSNIAEHFSNGYLFGAVLNRHGLQDDFCHFSWGRGSEAKLNNFMRLEPTFSLLEIPFNINMARDIMTERPGQATRLLYQLFIALNRKKERKLTGQSLECMRARGKSKLEKIETGIFQKRLKHQTPRQVDLDFESLIQKFHDRQRQHEELLAKQRCQEEERVQRERKEACHLALDRSRKLREKQSVMYAKLKPISPGKRPQGSPSVKGDTQAQVLVRERAAAHREAVASETRASISAFEASLQQYAMPVSEEQSRPFTTGDIPTGASSTQATQTAATTVPPTDYITQIRRRMEDSAVARKERERRRRKVLVDQMRALQDQEDLRREKMLVERLMRQSQQERRIATQLMHIRKQKDTIRNNRIYRQKQYEEQRMKEFQEALIREAELARQEEGEKLVTLQHHRRLYRQHLAEAAQKNYQKHYQLCRGVLLQVVEFCTKLAHYRELTQRLVPAKLVRDWKTLFIAGHSLFGEEEEEGEEGGREEGGSESLSSAGSEGQAKGDNDQLLDDADLHEYRQALVEWDPPDVLVGKLPHPPNPILSQAVYRLLDQVDPPQPPPPPPPFPRALLRACAIGKPFSGKTTVLSRLAESMGVCVLSVEELLHKAVEAYQTEKEALKEGNAPGNHEDNEESTGSGVQMEAGGEEKEDSANLLPQLSSLAVLGHTVHSAVVSGEAVEDATVVQVIVEELRSLPDGSAWILDDFPTTLQQAKLLASSLTGQAKPILQISRSFVLLTERESHEEELHAASGLDLVLNFAASTDVVLHRASQEGPTSDSKLEQIQHRITSCETHWPELRRWFHQFMNLTSVNANQEIDLVYTDVQKKVQEVVNRAKQADAMNKLGLPESWRGSATDLSSRSMTHIPALPTPSPKHQPVKDKPTQKSQRRRRPSSATSPHKMLIKKQKAALGTSKSSPTAGSSPRKGRKKPITSDDSGLFLSPVNLNAEPGTADWQYSRLPLDMELAQGLSGKWAGVEETYMGTLRRVFRLLRQEREEVCQYYYLRRKQFALYLSRPDKKQEYVSQWQATYNSLPTHLRQEIVMKAETHHRVDDLCDQLWDICDHRKEQGEKERTAIAQDRWIEDHIGVLTNHYITIMQIELDKFQDAVVLLRDYYTAMEGQSPHELPPVGRLPLIALGVTEANGEPASATSSMHSVRQEGGEGGGGGGGKGTATPTPPTAPASKRVPLLPRQPPGEPIEEKGAKKKGGAVTISPAPPTEDLSNLGLDHQLVVHAYNTAIGTVFNLMNEEVKGLDSAITNASKPPPTPQPEKKPDPKDEKGGKKTPGGKKGKGSPAKGKGAPPPDPEPEAVPTRPTISPEEVARKQQLLHMWKEHKAAIAHEETTVKVRLELIKIKALELIDSLQVKSASMLEEMEQWITQCYKQEVDSVSSLAEVLRNAVEMEEKLLFELKLPGPVFEIEETVVTYVNPTPPTPPPPLEESDGMNFTVQQVLSLYRQFSEMASSGFMVARIFIDTLLTFARAAIGDDCLPDTWRALNKEQVQKVCEMLYGHDADYIDWRQFLVFMAHPSPLPTAHQLVDADKRFNAVGSDGKVTREQYQSVGAWFTEDPNTSPDSFNRSEGLRKAYFEIFKEKSDGSGSVVDYRKMLLYFCADPDAQKGLFKALSLASGEPMNPEQKVNPSINIHVADFVKVLNHGRYKGTKHSMDATVLAITEEMMLSDVFEPLNPSDPNKAPVVTLLADAVALEYLDKCSAYSLPEQDLQAHLKSAISPEQEQTTGTTDP